MNTKLKKTYTAVTMEQHPLTGDAVPRTKVVTPETTVGELLDWGKGTGPKDYPVDDLRIVENT